MKRKAADSTVIDFPGIDEQALLLRQMSLGVMDVLTPVIGFENGSYALHCAGFEYIGDLAVAARADIANVRGITENKLKRIAGFMRRRGLAFETEPSAWQKWRAETIGEDEPAPVARDGRRPVLRLVKGSQARLGG